ncbi:MAG: rhamnose transport system ATP-binding protein [Actinomycetota bacterium]|jgi:rhamnose transport system ATP-binding protein|nr:rhamnose transport system ATP-binding protein [Actinomycetota bacterium]MDQ1666957.1 rhamnose transport system ATP-binding protein [Actinomycetota bacterium]
MTTTHHEGHTARPASDTPVLRLTGVTKRYGGVQALRGVDFELMRGEVHAIVGENGAGKSTLIKIISGAEVADQGEIEIDGHGLASGSTTSALGAGIATVYQEPQLFGELTVAENVFIGRELRNRGIVDRAGQRERVLELLDRIGLHRDLADVRVADMPVAEQQLVSIAKALSQDPRILILDEPSAILTDREIETMFSAVRAMRDSGVAVIYISHRLDELAQITDRVTVLRDGSAVASRPTSELSVRDVAELMVGHAVDAGAVNRTVPDADPVLRVEGLTRVPKFADVSFTLRPGEIVAMYGLIGSGAADVARALFGIDPADEGQVIVGGRPVVLAAPADAVRNGISMLPANRKVQGVFGPKSIAFNISSGHLRLLSKWGLWVDRSRERTIATDFIRRISIKAPGPATAVDNLSGGNQQKVVLARQLVERPRILLLEEPTQGVDVGAKDEIHRIILELADGGGAVLVISSDLPEVQQLADRILVVRGGAITAEFARGSRQADLLAAAAGDDSDTETRSS